MKYKYYLWWDFYTSSDTKDRQPDEYGEIVKETKDYYSLKAIKARGEKGWIFYNDKIHILQIKKDDEWLEKGCLKLFKNKEEMFLELL